MITISDPNRFVKAVVLDGSYDDLVEYINKYFKGSKVISTANRIRLVLGTELDHARAMDIPSDDVILNYIKSGVLDSELS